MRFCGAACEAISEPGGDGSCHEEEHGSGEDEAVGDPVDVELAGGLGVEGAEEALEAAGRTVRVQNAGVAGLPGEETSEESERDGQPGPEDGRDLIGLVRAPGGG